MRELCGNIFFFALTHRHTLTQTDRQTNKKEMAYGSECAKTCSLIENSSKLTFKGIVDHYFGSPNFAHL